MITAIIQARFSSARLPGKVLLPLGEKPVLAHVIERATSAAHIAGCIVATSDDASDDVIDTFCKERNIPCFRGNLNDVLDRYYQCAKEYNLEHICRITADCPLIDPELIDRAAQVYKEGGYDYVATAKPVPTYPDGLDLEIFSFAALEKTSKEARLPSEREHVTPYIWKHPELFTMGAITNDVDLSFHRWTIDEAKDYEFLKIIVKKVHPLTTQNILSFLDQHPDIQAINAAIGRDEGYQKSLAQDKPQTP